MSDAIPSAFFKMNSIKRCYIEKKKKTAVTSIDVRSRHGEKGKGVGRDIEREKGRMGGKEEERERKRSLHS